MLPFQLAEKKCFSQLFQVWNFLWFSFTIITLNCKIKTVSVELHSGIMRRGFIQVLCSNPIITAVYRLEYLQR